MGSKAGGLMCLRFYGMLKLCWHISDTDMQNSHSFIHSSYSLPDVSAGRIARELWWMSQEFSPASTIITMALHAHISLGEWTIGPLMATVLRHLTPSTWSRDLLPIGFNFCVIQDGSLTC
jgi:hypothetical protein